MSLFFYAFTILIILTQRFENRLSTGTVQPQDITLGLFFIFIIVLFTLKLGKNKKPRLDKTHRFLFDVLFDLHLRYKFLKQSKESLLSLKNAARAIIGPQAKQPAVLLLLASEQSKETAYLLGARLIRICSAALQEPLTLNFVKQNMTLEGTKYRGVSDFWDFYHIMKLKLRNYKMVIVKDIQSVHPHAVTILSSLTHEVFCPYEQALIIVVLETSNLVPQNIGSNPALVADWWVEQTFGPFLDTTTMTDLKRTLTARPVVVFPEDIEV